MKNLYQLPMKIGISLVLAIFAFPAVSQNYPAEAIRIVVPSQAGAPSDTLARLLGKSMSDQLGQPVIIDNQPGASGLIGLQAALRAKSDGYTLVLGTMGHMVVAPNLNKQPFDVRSEFIPVASLFSNDLLLVSSPKFGPTTISETVEYSKRNPGKVRVGTNGVGSFPHLTMELLRERAGLVFDNVPYKGDTTILGDVTTGRIELAILSLSFFLPHVEDGKVRGMAVTGKHRAKNAPTIPTFAESVPGFEAHGWFGLFARKGVPTEIVSRLNIAANNALETPELREYAKSAGLDLSSGSPEHLSAIWNGDYEKWSAVISDTGLSK